jgi:hypothetical protein
MPGQVEYKILIITTKPKHSMSTYQQQPHLGAGQQIITDIKQDANLLRSNE